MHTHEKREPLKSNQAMQWFESDHQIKVGSECMATLPILVWYKYLSSHWTKNFLDTFQGKNVVTCSGTKKRRHKKRGQRKKKSLSLEPILWMVHANMTSVHTVYSMCCSRAAVRPKPGWCSRHITLWWIWTREPWCDSTPGKVQLKRRQGIHRQRSSICRLHFLKKSCQQCSFFS